jgi:hypothetical protein
VSFCFVFGPRESRGQSAGGDSADSLAGGSREGGAAWDSVRLQKSVFFYTSNLLVVAGFQHGYILLTWSMMYQKVGQKSFLL